MTVLDYAMMVEDSIIDTFMTEYRLKPEPCRQVAGARSGRWWRVALCDRLSDGISMVYSFYEPEAARRGLGTYMILEHIALRQAARPALPLSRLLDQGLAQDELQAPLPPQEQLTGNGWVRL